MKERHQRLICVVLICGLLFLSACASHNPQMAEADGQTYADQELAPKYVAHKSRILYPTFHKPPCASIGRIRKEKRVYLHTLEEALASGREACRECEAMKDIRAEQVKRQNLERRKLFQSQSREERQAAKYRYRENKEKKKRLYMCYVFPIASMAIAGGLTALDRDNAGSAFGGAAIVSVGMISFYWLMRFAEALGSLGC